MTFLTAGMPWHSHSTLSTKSERSPLSMPKLMSTWTQWKPFSVMSRFIKKTTFFLMFFTPGCRCRSKSQRWDCMIASQRGSRPRPPHMCSLWWPGSPRRSLHYNAALHLYLMGLTTPHLLYRDTKKTYRPANQMHSFFFNFLTLHLNPSVFFFLSPPPFILSLVLLTYCTGRYRASKPGRWGCLSFLNRHSPPCPTSGRHHATPAWSTGKWSVPGSSRPAQRNSQKTTVRQFSGVFLITFEQTSTLYSSNKFSVHR